MEEEVEQPTPPELPPEVQAPAAPELPPLPAPPARVLVLGCGISGVAMARWCAGRGSEVTVVDTRAEPPQLPQLREQVPQARFVAGEFTAALLEGQEQVLRSPGLTPAQVAPVIDAARAQGIPVRGELSLFT